MCRTLHRVCTACGNNNFAFRATCNMRKCGAPKPDGTGAPAAMDGGGGGGGYDGPAPQGVGSNAADAGPAPEGSWACSCGNVNYPFRTECNRRNCGLPRGAEAPPASQGQAAMDAPEGGAAAADAVGDAVPAAEATAAVDDNATAAAAAVPAEQEAVEEAAAPAAEAAEAAPELEAGAEA